MDISHIYATPDGESHMETIEVPADWQKPGIPVVKIEFLEMPVGTHVDWHPVPNRRIAVVRSGQIEITATDGSRRLFRPGDARLIEDTAGRGHMTKVVGDEPSISIVVTLPD
jgi:hypothetical protein